MTEYWVDTRVRNLLSRLGSSIEVWSESGTRESSEEMARYAHDVRLLRGALTGRNRADATKLYQGVRPALKLRELRDASHEVIKRSFVR